MMAMNMISKIYDLYDVQHSDDIFQPSSVKKNISDHVMLAAIIKIFLRIFVLLVIKSENSFSAVWVLYVSYPSMLCMCVGVGRCEYVSAGRKSLVHKCRKGMEVGVI